MVKKVLKILGVIYLSCWIAAGIYYFQNKAEVEFKLSHYMHQRKVTKALDYFKKTGYQCTGRPVEDCLTSAFTKDPGFLYASDLRSFKDTYLSICKETCYDKDSLKVWNKLVRLTNIQALWIVRQNRSKGERKAFYVTQEKNIYESELNGLLLNFEEQAKKPANAALATEYEDIVFNTKVAIAELNQPIQE